MATWSNMVSVVAPGMWHLVSETGTDWNLRPFMTIYGQIYGEKSSHVRDSGGVSKADIELRLSGAARGAWRMPRWR